MCISPNGDYMKFHMNKERKVLIHKLSVSLAHSKYNNVVKLQRYPVHQTSKVGIEYYSGLPDGHNKPDEQRTILLRITFIYKMT